MIKQAMSNESETLEFAERVDRLYRAAISADPSSYNQIAYAVYLAGHGRSIEALQQFSQLLSEDRWLSDRAGMNELIQHVHETENRLEQCELNQWSRCPQGSAINLLGAAGMNRPGDRRRQTGHLLMDLARTSCEAGWQAVAVASLRKALRCFEGAARVKKHQRY